MLDLSRNRAVGFIDWLGVDVANYLLFTLLGVSCSSQHILGSEADL